MALDSLLGGASGSGQAGQDAFTSLSPETQAIINALLNDTVGGQASVTTLAGGGAILSSQGAGGEVQSALMPTPGDTNGIQGTVTNGDVQLNVDLPAGVSTTLQGKDAQSVGQANNYIQSVADQYLPSNSTDPNVRAANTEVMADVKSAISQFAPTDSVAVRFVAVSSDAPSTSTGTRPDVTFDAGAGTGKELMAFVMGDIGSTNTLVLKNVESAVIVGSGSARIEGSTGGTLTGSLGNQALGGGSGNDTLVGGSGTDTLTGGLGSDTFGVTSFNAHLTVTDFQVGVDVLGFKLDGVTTIGQLAALYTGATSTADGTGAVVHFGPNLDITLIGVAPSQLTLDMLKLSL